MTGDLWPEADVEPDVDDMDEEEEPMVQYNESAADRKRKREFINQYTLTDSEAADANRRPTAQTRLDRARELTEAAWVRAEAARIQEEQTEVSRRSSRVPNAPSGATRSGIHPLR